MALALARRAAARASRKIRGEVFRTAPRWPLWQPAQEPSRRTIHVSSMVICRRNEEARVRYSHHP